MQTTTQLPKKAIDLASGRNFAVFTTLLPSGYPQSHVMWVDTDGEHILINTEVHRQKFQNAEHNPKVTVTVIEDGNWWSWVEVRGDIVERVTGPEARHHIDLLAKKYLGVDEYPNQIQSERVILKIAPRQVKVFPQS